MKKSFRPRCHQLLSGFLAKGHLPRVLRQSRLSAKDKGDNELIPGTLHRSSGIYLMAEENPGKPLLGDRLMKVVRPFMASNGVPCLEIKVDRIARHIREGEGRTEGEAHVGNVRPGIVEVFSRIPDSCKSFYVFIHIIQRFPSRLRLWNKNSVTASYIQEKNPILDHSNFLGKVS